MATQHTPVVNARNYLPRQNLHAHGFCDLSPHALAEYHSLGRHTLVTPGNFLFYQGQSAHGVYVLFVGHVKLTSLSKEGKTLLVRIAKPGDILGLSSALADTTYELTAQALGPVQVTTFARQDFLHFIERHTEGSMHAARMLNQEYRGALNSATRLALSVSIAGRVAQLLLELAAEHETLKSRLDLALTHEDIASMLGTTRESVCRVMNEFKRTQVVSMEGPSIKILRRDVLVTMD